MGNYEHALLLSASRKSWQVSSVHGTEVEREKLNIFESIWSRDKKQCYYCGFVADKWQEVHHLNDDHSDNSLENLVTICALCHQSFHLNTVSTTNGGDIIWLPEVSQQDLNHLCRAIFIAEEYNEHIDITKITKINDSNEDNPIDNLNDKDLVHKLSKMSNQMLAIFNNRKNHMDNFFLGKASDAGTFGQVLLNMPQAKYEKRSEFIDNFKLLPKSSRFPIQIKYWKKTMASTLPLETWVRLIKK